MAIALGSRLGTYEIVAAIGAGGMGEVYRARDTRLDRTVAIKVLPPSFRDDPGLKARFRREAQLISSINDPHICALYDVGEQDGVEFLVMEHVEGQTLAARLAKGPLRRDEALRYAIDVASALASAHRHGIVHRDLKPGNVMLTKTGAKLLDFGLAKPRAADVVSLEAGASVLTRERHDVTAAGTIVGTLHYMSPEQLEGKDTDARSDVFAFGAVLYEMLTGRRAFAADSQAATIGAILEKEPPPISTIAQITDPSLERLVRRCLAKDPDQRWQTAYDLARELEWVAQAPVSSAARPESRRPVALWALGIVLAVVAAAAWGASFRIDRGTPAVATATQFVVLPPEGHAFGNGPQDRVPSFVGSPDGRTLAFLATDGTGRRSVWVRPLDSLGTRTVSGTDGAAFPFWSPDSDEIAFFAQGKLKKVALSGGAPVVLADVISGQGGAWNRDGTILYAPGENHGLHRVPENGGAPTPVTTLPSGPAVRLHAWPQFLPDGRHFLYWMRGRPAPGSFYIGSLDAGGGNRLLDGTFMATYAEPGFLLFLRDGTLYAQPFDPSRQALSGEPATLADSIAFSSTNARASFTVSDNGVLAYRRSGLLASASLVWTDRSGKTIGSAGAPGDYVFPRLSPDETRLAAELHDLRTGIGDLWLIDLKRGSSSRVTFDGLHHNAPVWSPDSSQVVFAGRPDGVANLHLKNTNTSEPDEPLLPIGPNRVPTDWSSDGRHILFEQPGPKTRSDIWVVKIPEREASLYLQTDFAERDGRFSPDGRWVAYVSDESGRDEVYVRPFPASSTRWAISVGGGARPRWRGDGKELFYHAADNTFMAVPLRTTPRFDPGVPQPLFKMITRARDFSVSADGQRVLLSPEFAGSAVVHPIVVVINWPALLQK